jgi:hypothetical protein
MERVRPWVGALPVSLLQTAPNLVCIPPNVVRRGTIFHFRRAIPSYLRALIGRNELTCSLRTSDRRLAGARARELYLHWEAIFAELRSETPMLSDDLLAHLGQEFYATVLDSDAMRGARITEQLRQGWIAHWKGVAERARQDLGGNGTLYAATTTYYMLRRLNIDPKSLTQSELHQARCTLLRVGIDLATAIAERYEGNFNYQPSDELLKRKFDLAFGPGEPPRTASASNAAPSLTPTLCPTLGAASAAFIEQQLAANHWDKQTVQQSRKSYELFGAIAGDKPLGAYTRQDAATFKNTLERLPADYGKGPEFRGKSPLEIFALDKERANKPGRLSTRTVQRPLTALSTLWTDAISQDYVTVNLFPDSSFRGKRVRRIIAICGRVQILRGSSRHPSGQGVSPGIGGRRRVYHYTGCEILAPGDCPIFWIAPGGNLPAAYTQTSNASRESGISTSMTNLPVNSRIARLSGLSRFIPS